MDNIWQWILVHLKELLLLGTVVIVLLKRALEGTLQDFVAELIGAVIDLFEGELEKVAKEQVEAVASWLWRKAPLPALVRLVFTEAAAKDLAWRAWQWYLANRQANILVLKPKLAALKAKR